MSRQEGFTLLEVAVSGAIMTVIIFAMMSMGNYGANDLANDTNKTLATAVATSVMEDLLNRTPADPLLAAGPHAQSYDQNGNPVAGAGVYQASWLVTANSPLVGIMFIQEQVQWTVSGYSSNVSLSTYRSAQ